LFWAARWFFFKSRRREGKGAVLIWKTDCSKECFPS